MDSRKKITSTLKDVANAAGVSLGTASKVMAGADGVSDARRQQVWEAARQLGYRRNSLAAELRSSRSTSIGFVVPDLTNSFFIELLCVVEDHALASGYRLLLAHAQEDPEREAERIRFVLSRQVAGMIIIPCHGYAHAIDELRECDVPLVMADRVDDTFPANTVTTDSRRAARDGTEHLIALGHKRITFIVNALDLVNSRERADGYLAAMKRAGLTRHARIVVCGMTDTESHTVTLGLLAERERPTALFTGANVATLGALRAIRDAELRLPEDISLLSFDDAPWMSVLHPRISSIHQPVDAVGGAIWQLLHKQLQGEAAEPVHLRMRADLRVRESTAPPRRSTEKEGSAETLPAQQNAGRGRRRATLADH
ncbi:LacI family DNA-binding transcriptional regulator [Caballeronia sp. LZ034LL]|uniref:LacI family DNA-binding transcriptional regulator n=1 Tax=Caballeronia sp. LZ034LL TaxID=3038567 RepID=UPI0028655DE0|nr:LacI family DNA-binding transcriptional regulator [Caballeronia sp. LZ034LL]MDR5836877.1 LacI family DNA-binding transcriptional regulator [Caballeronia sp. LZ034LL]